MIYLSTDHFKLEDLSGRDTNTFRGRVRELLELLFEADTKLWKIFLSQHSDRLKSAEYQRPSRKPQKQSRLQPGEIDRMVERYKSGATMCKLAKEFGCHRVTVSKHLKSHRKDLPLNK